MKDFCGSVLWDPDPWLTEDPDFTECFQLSLLIWTPCAFLILFTPLELYFIRQSKLGQIPWNLLNIGKIIVTMALVILVLINIGIAVSLQGANPEQIFAVHFTTPGIQAATFLLSIILLLLHRSNGIRSSGLIFIFWFSLMVLAIPQYRTEIRYLMSRNNDEPPSNGEEAVDGIDWRYFKAMSYMAYFPLVVVVFVLNCFSDQRPVDAPKTKTTSPEEGASFLRKLFFQWFDPMAWKGYRRPLEATDMWDPLKEDITENIIPEFDKYWQESVKKNEQARASDLKKGKKKKGEDTIKPGETNGSVLPAMVKAFGGPFWFAGVIKLVIDLLSFASPQLLGLLITFTGSDQPLWNGLVYAFALVGVAWLTLLLNGQYFYKTFKVGFKIRSALISAIYRKAMRISSSAKKDSTVGEIVNLMAVDAHRFLELTSYLHLIWSGPLIIALALYFLYDLLGVAIFAGVAVLILMVPINIWIAARMRSLQIEQMVEKDERVKVMNEILNGIKVLKLYAWEPSFEKNVVSIRDREVKILKVIAYYSSGTFFAWTLTPFLVSLACFATFVLIDDKNVLDANIAFMSLALLNILRGPMAMFPMIIAMSMQAWVSITRMNKFMNNRELDPNNVTHKASAKALEIHNGTFKWDTEEATLRNINLETNKGELAAVVGPVGCGKSSLISALLGEMDKSQGTVNTDGKIAYVAQQAWIQNSTLQDNILFGKPMKKEFYDKVIEACALKPDIAMLPGGDQTEIGEKGINLSGGQKQRISFARAVYANADIYFLDDPLSAVDSHVGKHIFDNVIGPKGLLVGKTRLLVTHGVAFLPQIDNIFVMSNGEITESGNYKSLLAQKGLFSEFLLQHISEMDDEDELMEIKQALADKPEGKVLLERAFSIRSTSSRGSVRSRKRSRTVSERSKQEEKEALVAQIVGTTLIEKEESATGKVGIDVYWRYIKGIGLWMMFVTLAMNVLNQGFSLYANIWLTEWASDPRAGEPEVRDLYLGVYGGLGGGQAISLFVGSVVFAIGCLNAAKFLHNKLLTHTFRLPMSFFDTTPLGRIMNRFSKDVDIVDNILPMSVRSWIIMFFSVIGVIIIISYSTPIFLSVVLPIGLVYYFIQVFYVATSRQLKRIESVTRSPIYSHFSESLAGQSTIRAYGKQNTFTQENADKVDHNQQCSYPSIIANRWLAVRLEIVGSLIILFAALFAVLGRNTISQGLVGLSVSSALSITQVLAFFVRMSAEVETNIVAIERMEEYSELKQEAQWKKGEVDPKWPKDGVVEFDDLQVRYREGLDLVLKGISFKVNSMEKVGIVGRTGAGKSSLTLALFRIIEAAGGKIVIDGKNIADLGLHNLRSRLTIIPQDPVLFSGTLRMNIDPFNHYSDDDIWRVLEHSHLKAFVKGLPTGILHEISEGGENLSVGQRQLICLSRALLRKTKVLVLDEATAAIDLETDDLIQKTIRTEFNDCTILTIAHRLNTIIDSDKVVVLDQGKIVEFDTPQNLLADPSTIFYGMAKNSGLVSNNNGNANNKSSDKNVTSTVL